MASSRCTEDVAVHQAKRFMKLHNKPRAQDQVEKSEAFLHKNYHVRGHFRKRKWCYVSLLIVIAITPTVSDIPKPSSPETTAFLNVKNASHTFTGSVLFCQEPTVLWLITPQWLKDDFCVKKTPFSDDSPLVPNGELQYITKDGRW